VPSRQIIVGRCVSTPHLSSCQAQTTDLSPPGRLPEARDAGSREGAGLAVLTPVMEYWTEGEKADRKEYKQESRQSRG
jgi:hypothetical protein